jgi:DNA-binding NtrC family response regulator
VKLLIVEDELDLRRELRRLFARFGYDVVEAGSVADTTALDLSSFALILTDLRLPGGSGTDLIARAGRVPVLVMTSYATVKSAVEAMRLGAVDYIAKPLDHAELTLLVDQIVRRPRHAPADDQAGSFDGMIGTSAPMREVFERIKKVAATSSNVLILGESGTGKELVARAIHTRSTRSGREMVSVNCAAIPSMLIESELFGHEKGAFTGAIATRAGLIEAADGGTLFLDEIGELPPPVQAQLLRVLQHGEVRRVGANRVHHVDVRLLAATHRDLPSMIEAQTFRADLYFRLRVVDIHLPPLRARGDDVDELALYLLDRVCARLGLRRRTLTPEAVQAIRAHPWLGNVRELENAIERAVILCDVNALLPEHLGLAAVGRPIPVPSDDEDLSLLAYFKRFVLTHQDHMSESDLAAKLGISRKALWERRLKHALPRPKSS